MLLELKHHATIHVQIGLSLSHVMYPDTFLWLDLKTEQG